MLLISDSAEEIKSLKHKLSSKFDMKDIGKARKILGIEIIRNIINRVLNLKQSSCLEKVLINIFVITQQNGILKFYNNLQDHQTQTNKQIITKRVLDSYHCRRGKSKTLILLFFDPQRFSL